VLLVTMDFSRAKEVRCKFWKDHFVHKVGWRLKRRMRCEKRNILSQASNYEDIQTYLSTRRCIESREEINSLGYPNFTILTSCNVFFFTLHGRQMRLEDGVGLVTSTLYFVTRYVT
jgi:hypothetical protein